MSESVAIEQSSLTQAGLGQVERVVDIFVAPAKTFTDILRSTAWWLPFLLSVVSALAFAFAVDRQVGFAQVAETQMHLSPAQEERLNALTPEDRAAQMQKIVGSYKFFTYASPAVVLVFSAVAALVLWITFKFGLGSQATFRQFFCLWMYANLPRLLSTVVTLVTLYFGNSPETFNLKEPAGTNLGYYLPDAAPWLSTLLGFFDVVGLWVLVLLVVGGAIVAKVKIGQSAAVVVGWWLLSVIVSVAATAAFS
jgi:hypothetical protein